MKSGIAAVGLASAVLLDALIVRSVLVPAVMLLLGELNWRLPGFLDRVIPHLRVEGAAARADAAAISPRHAVNSELAAG